MQIPDEQIYQLIGEIVVQHRKTALDLLVAARELAEYRKKDADTNVVAEQKDSAQ
jgi:hypothetical protein